MLTRKNLLRTFTLLFVLGLNFLLYAQDRTAEEYLTERGEVYFSFDHPGSKVLEQLNRVISIDRSTGGIIHAYANQKGFQEFLETGIEFDVLTPPSMLWPAEMKANVDIDAIEDWDFYPTYEAYVDMMNQFAMDYPDLCTVFSIGETIDGHELLFARISDNIGTAEDEPQFLLTCTIHGDETTGYVTSLRLIDYLLSNYGNNDLVDSLVNGLDIWINPLANPDGTYAGGNSSVNGAIRYNANGVDLNRNYADPEDGPHPDGNEWQPETLLFMELAEENNFVMSVNTHGGAEVCNYPWDTWAELHPDDDWWYYVCRQYADTVHAYAPAGYMSGFDDGITNGYQWYTISGGRQDYMNYFQQCREFTLEMSDTKLLPAWQLPDLWEYNYRSLLHYMRQCLYGVKGTVTDAETGEPLLAKVFIEAHDADSSWVHTNATTGNYFRPLFEGTYDITFSAYGYYPETIEMVSVNNEYVTLLNVELEGGDLIGDFSASNTHIPIGSTVDFTDLSFGSPVSWEWTFEGGIPATSAEQHPQGILYETTGSYDVSLTVSDGTNSVTITKTDYITASEDFVIQNTTVTTCSGIFYDTGGAGDNYSDNEDFIMTFLPAQAGSKVSLEFIAFTVEYDNNCDYDYLRIYDGENTSAALIGEYCGSNSPGTVLATNNAGALTFEFHSDFSVNESGWIAVVSCEGILLPPVADFTASTTWLIEGGSVAFSDLSANEPVAWSWQFEGGEPATSDEQNPLVTYPNPGVYSVSLTVANNAGSNTLVKQDYITVDQWSAVSQQELAPVTVFPNPASDRITICASTSILEIRVQNLQGELVQNSRPLKKEVTVSCGQLPAGVYLVEVRTESSVVIKKLSVQP